MIKTRKKKKKTKRWEKKSKSASTVDGLIDLG